MPSFSHLLTYILISSAVNAATVQLGDTNVVGLDLPSGAVEFYGGIPFAEPPVGSLRFKPAVLKQSLNASTFNATTFGSSCLQVQIPQFAQIPLPPVLSEDCLSVNVFRPQGLNTTASLPVMVHHYGGAFLIDAIPHLDPSALVERSVARGTPMIFVSFNYRLGPLGFPTGAEAAENGALNIGLKDQLVALQWVQNNIGAFGGDKDKVTLFGLSAGSISISALYLNSELEKYARGAILSSGTVGTTPLFNATRGQQNWNNFVSAIPECASSVASNDTFECLQRDDLNSTHVLDAIAASLLQSMDSTMPWVPTLDGPDGLIPELPSELYKKGNFSKIPFISGDVLDEGTIFTPFSINNNETTLHEAIFGNYTTHSATLDEELNKAIDELLTLYPNNPALGSPFNTGNQTFGLSPQYKRWSAIVGDQGFQATRRLWMQTAARAGIKSYGFLFSYAELAAGSALGISHGSEVPYIFGFTPVAGAVFSPSEAAKKMSNHVMDYLISFVVSLNPNDGIGSERPAWPEYCAEAHSILALNGPENSTTIRDDYRAEQIEFVMDNSKLFGF